MDHNRTLHDILSLGIAHMEYIRKQLTDLKLTDDDTPESQRGQNAQFLMKAASVINDVMHPAYPMIKEIFPDEKVHALIDYYKFLHSKHPARKEEYECPCIACGNTVILDDNEVDKVQPTQATKVQ